MKNLYKLLLIICIVLVFPSSVVIAEGELPNGYSAWSSESSGDPNEISATQYGRRLPETWSEWQTELPDTPFHKVGETETRYYAYDGETAFWNDAKAKTLFTWDFGERKRVVYFYADVDNYVSGSYTNYSAPALQLYCDGRAVARVGRHDYLNNWNPNIDCECTLLRLDMSDNSGSGRNRTHMVGTWATTLATYYSYVVTWKEGSDWRFDEPYPELYGDDSQLPVTREVYSHPIIYNISYDLDGGEATGELITAYTVLDEVNIPDAHKEGYDFIGWFEGEDKVSKIEKGTYRDIALIARYDRHKPFIFAGYAYFDEDNRHLPIRELFDIINAQATDEVDGDITGNIKVEYIRYEESGITVSSPSYLDLSMGQAISIGLSVTNSGGKSATIEKKYYILGKGEEFEKSDDIKVYSRYIREDYKGTLNESSIWHNDGYRQVLEEAYAKARKD